VPGEAGKDRAGSAVEPLSPQCALTLWRVFMERVEPLARIMFRWAIDELRAKSSNAQDSQPLTITEHALVQAIFYAGANSMTDDDCKSLVQLPRSIVIAECQTRCEDALLQTNLFCMSDLNTIKAVLYYVVCILSSIDLCPLTAIGSKLRSTQLTEPMVTHGYDKP
jgi:hypothetical protein